MVPPTSTTFPSVGAGGPRIKVAVTNDVTILTRVLCFRYICHTRVFDVSQRGGVAGMSFVPIFTLFRYFNRVLFSLGR